MNELHIHDRHETYVLAGERLQVLFELEQRSNGGINGRFVAIAVELQACSSQGYDELNRKQQIQYISQWIDFFWKEMQAYNIHIMMKVV